VSRSTIIKTYELLLLEKYIVSKVGSGYTTASTVYDSAILEKPLKRVQIILQFQKKQFHFKKNKPVLTEKFSMKILHLDRITTVRSFLSKSGVLYQKHIGKNAPLNFIKQPNRRLRIITEVLQNI
jgi:DNA-binding transcriptional MocR family regulator